MNMQNEEEFEKLMNEYFAKIRKHTIETLGNETESRDLMAYMLANMSHVAELMWETNVDIQNAISLANASFKSMYERCKEFYKEDGNEEAK